jgi:hypothetical protein
MRKYIIGFIVGVAITAFLLLQALIVEGKQKYRHGTQSGKIDGAMEIIDFLGQHFPASSSGEEESPIDRYRMQDRALLVIDHDGERTLRVDSQQRAEELSPAAAQQSKP